MHLEALPRREEFRAARERVRAACGDCTLAGEFALLPEGASAGGMTVTSPGAVGHAYFLIDGDHRYPLEIGVNSVGRLSDNTVSIRDEHVSRRHCAIIIHRDGQCEVHDVASKNGTVLNGRKISGPTRIRPGDQITLCTRKLTLQSDPVLPAEAG
ncbi:hypothetical protein FRUB_05591 [Fimbriiglobus ruber]|uniref:FHA domain-containing protein n=2 Tax=Fimbriiglobus ruber TaxID=1908690 RepID=A0A225DDR9_9BACT|nr:hypothetical protein FRUB_05591 [Fimbriiglobus ruber]